MDGPGNDYVKRGYPDSEKQIPQAFLFLIYRLLMYAYKYMGDE